MPKLPDPSSTGPAPPPDPITITGSAGPVHNPQRTGPATLNTPLTTEPLPSDAPLPTGAASPIFSFVPTKLPDPISTGPAPAPDPTTSQAPSPTNAAPSSATPGVDPNLVPILGGTAGQNPTGTSPHVPSVRYYILIHAGVLGTGDCDGAVNGTDGKPIKVPCTCPPSQQVFLAVRFTTPCSQMSFCTEMHARLGAERERRSWPRRAQPLGGSIFPSRRQYCLTSGPYPSGNRHSPEPERTWRRLSRRVYNTFGTGEGLASTRVSQPSQPVT